MAYPMSHYSLELSHYSCSHLTLQSGRRWQPFATAGVGNDVLRQLPESRATPTFCGTSFLLYNAFGIFRLRHLILTSSYDLQASITIWPFLYNTLAILHGCTIWLQYFVSSVEAAIFQSHGCAYLHAAFSHFSSLPSTVQSASGKEFLGTPLRK